MTTCSRMIKYLVLPLIIVGCTAPVTDPPAHACSPRLDGKPTYCPPFDSDILPKKDDRDIILVPREEARGEIDITNPHHWQSLQLMFQRNVNKGKIEQTATKPSDAINNALAEFNYGSNGSTEPEELLQLPSNGNQ